MAISETQFLAITTLRSMRSVQLQAALHSVLVEGMTQSEACRAHNVASNNLNRAVAAARETIALSVAVVTGQTPELPSLREGTGGSGLFKARDVFRGLPDVQI